MSYIVRDPRFSMSMAEAEVPISANFRRGRVSYAKQIERRIISVWKVVTRTTRKQPRNSFIHPDFVVITTRRKSTIQPQIYRYHN
ncbi:hypothetical protein JR316_0008005 [Psilocybe cubensis]|uniref:Uncharacterized protein n=2 Tax=Psilocybe cubensis TaxID=181762 RepID=A0A8H7XVT7_PSICU|nr:hypothetical protein JR316_0008005 [Psilocybe cubensis]KAH9479415.1 hypothetical protein JR316_0008005 [Psilocybe cubensis]